MAGLNRGLFRDSAATEGEDVVNGNPYIDVARAYYNSTMYDNNQQLASIDGMVDNVIPVFNCVPKVANTSASFSVSGDIEIISADKEWLAEAIEVLGLEQEKSFIARDLIIGKSILLELQSSNFSSNDDSYVMIGSETIPYGLAYYSADEYDLISAGGHIYQCEITGVRLMFEDGEYKQKESKKTYVRQEDNTVIMKEEVDGEVFNEFTFEAGVMPIVEITTSYDMRQLFYSIDRYNELDTFIRQVFYYCGEPILVGTGVNKISDAYATEVADDRFNTMKTFFAKNPEATIKLLEINGTSTATMISKQNELKVNITKDFPEFAISDVLSGGNVSEETTRIRLTEVLSRIQELRRNILIGFNALINALFAVEGKSLEPMYVKFGDMMEINLINKSGVVFEALDRGLISNESAMNSLKTLYIGEDVDAEIIRMGTTGETDVNTEAPVE